jgi:tetratricopeptide (TPR) repeat protein/transcriptional regulator with XRE-family HTH domain
MHRKYAPGRRKMEVLPSSALRREEKLGMPRGWWEGGSKTAGIARRKFRPLRSLVLRFVRDLCGVEQQELADKADYQKSTVSYFERGKVEPKPEAMERLMGALGVSPSTLNELLRIAEEIRDGEGKDKWVGPILVSGEKLRRAREFGRDAVSREGKQFEDYLVRGWVEEGAEKDRDTARQIGIYLRGQKNLVKVVREDLGCHFWALAEWLCGESLNLVAKDRDRAAECAEAARVVADLIPGDERFRSRLSGYCSGHIGNIQRARNDFEEAAVAFETCSRLLAAGEGGDPYDLLDVGRLMGMEASLRREQGRFTEALRLLREGLPIATKDIQPYLRLNMGIVLEQMGDAESAIQVLEEAGRQAPRHLLLSARYAVGVNLVHLGRHEEAEALLPEVARLCMETESKDYEMRVRWLSGRIAYGRGRTDEALGLFKSVQRAFIEQGNAYDAIVVALDLTKIYLGRGETMVVRRLAEEMAPVFVDKGVHHHAREALKLFETAALREAASVDFVVRVLNYLERARRSHGLRFEGIGP